MAIWVKWTERQEKIWADWVAARPQVIQDIIAKYDFRFDRLYRLKTTGQRVLISEYYEDGTVVVSVLQKFNRGYMPLDKAVFGIKPEDLEECDWEGAVEDGAQYQYLDDSVSIASDDTQKEQISNQPAFTFLDIGRKETSAMNELMKDWQELAAGKPRLLGDKTVEEIREAAELWFALMSVARLRMMGGAGFDAKSRETYKIPHDYRHLGIELWTQYDFGDKATSQPPEEREVAVKYLLDLLRIVRKTHAPSWPVFSTRIFFTDMIVEDGVWKLGLANEDDGDVVLLVKNHTTDTVDPVWMKCETTDYTIRPPNVSPAKDFNTDNLEAIIRSCFNTHKLPLELQGIFPSQRFIRKLFALQKE